ncbi:serine hydroxymethyltransferase [Candidatus Uhrbacteria bacterium]|nr:serine hydroxymethyltransferase [Candidatus Uhrbacteria bacterium]
MYEHLRKTDPETAGYLGEEIKRQQDGLELIASENYASPAVIEALGSPLVNKYSEGYFSKRYYGGNEFIDKIESLAIERAKKLFGAAHANVQPHSGSQANQAAFLAAVKPGDTILAMDLSHGGHLTHGSPVNYSGKLYRFVHYGIEKNSGLISMDEVARLARQYNPQMIIAGFSAYPYALDFESFGKIAKEIGAVLMVDMAHIAGLVAAKLHPNPFPHADIVTATTHKTLRGPRGGLILCKQEWAKKIDSAVFPGIQGGPLDNVIAAKAVAFFEALQPDFIEYQTRVLENAKAMARVFGIHTDNHLMMIDVSRYGMRGNEAEKLLDTVGIYVNKNMIPFDTGTPMDPSGVRIGTPAITTRGINAEESRSLAVAILDILSSKGSADSLHKAKQLVLQLSRAHPLPYQKP